MGIDDRADRSTRNPSPGTRFQEEFLASRPKGQWASYIDDTALCVADNIGIGSTDLDRYNFGEEVGEYYAASLEAVGNLNRSLKYSKLSTDEIGTLAYTLNELDSEIEAAEGDIGSIGSALNAFVQKLVLTQDIDLTYQTEAFPETVAELLLSLIDDPAAANELSTLIAAIDSTRSSLLEELDRPQMVTPLWRHQRDALRSWLKQGRCGFVDMATATGKTVLGLATIALRYGSLYRDDAAYLGEDGIRLEISTPETHDDVLIVAHSNFILEQWKREFDRHLCIPPARTAQDDEDIIHLTWGRVHLRTPQGLSPENLGIYDLVIFDEAHHYANSAGWGELLESCENDVLALSGSVDAGGEDEQNAVRNRLKRHVGPLAKEYTSTQAQADGITPEFEWGIYFTEFESESDDLLETTTTVKAEWKKFVQRLEAGNAPLDVDRPLSTHKSVRTVAQLFEAGRKAKAQDTQFRNLATALSSRHMLSMNQTPSIDAVVDIATEHNNEKVIVLTQKRSEAQAVVERLQDEGTFPKSAIKHVTSEQSCQEQNNEVADYDACETAAVLVGTGSRIGEGANIKSATIGINISKGAVNRSLIQRIGRVLRNPTDDKEALFYNVVGVPTNPDARIPNEDGLDLLEDLAHYLTYGDSLEKPPAFTASSAAVEESLAILEREGCKRLRELQQTNDYTAVTEEDDPRAYGNLCTVRDLVDKSESTSMQSAILSTWTRPVERRDIAVQQAGDGPAVIDGEKPARIDDQSETENPLPSEHSSSTETSPSEDGRTDRTPSSPEKTSTTQDTMQPNQTDSRDDSETRTIVTIDGALAALVDMAVQTDANSYETRGQLTAAALEAFVGPALQGERESLAHEITRSRRPQISADPITSKLLQLRVESDDSYSTPAAFIQGVVEQTLGIEDEMVEIEIPGYPRYEFAVDQLLQSEDCPYEGVNQLVQAALETNLEVSASSE